jgi:hypothetical protein
MRSTKVEARAGIQSIGETGQMPQEGTPTRIDLRPDPAKRVPVIGRPFVLKYGDITTTYGLNDLSVLLTFRIDFERHRSVGWARGRRAPFRERRCRGDIAALTKVAKETKAQGSGPSRPTGAVIKAGSQSERHRKAHSERPNPNLPHQ